MNDKLMRIIYIIALIIAFILLIVFYPAPANGSSYCGELVDFSQCAG